MVISDPFAQLLLLIAIRGVPSPPLLSKTIILYFIWLSDLPAAGTVWPGAMPWCLGEGLIPIRPSGSRREGESLKYCLSGANENR